MSDTEQELMSRIHQEITDSLGYDGEISVQREEAIKYYYALPLVMRLMAVVNTLILRCKTQSNGLNPL